MSKTKKEQIKVLENILKSKFIIFMPTKNPFSNSIRVKLNNLPELKEHLINFKNKLKSELQK